MDERSDWEYWVGFNMVSGIGPARIRRLIDRFENLGAAWSATPAGLREAGLDDRSVDSLRRVRDSDLLERELGRIEQAGVQVLTWRSPGFPQRLLHVYNPPIILYVRGVLPKDDDPAVAVVGTRKVTGYGQQVTREICRELVASGISVVSGLARGVDSWAHRATVEAGGTTVAVLASGVDVIYPSENRQLAEQIVDCGALISEYPLGSRPDAVNFPARNRLISGLTLGTLVIEAGERSGALITAAFALEQGREVFAVPGNIFSQGSKGCHWLIKQGAKLVTCAMDILEELNLTNAGEQLDFKAILPENETEKAILDLLRSEPLHIDEIVRASGLPVSAVTSSLTMMELKGTVRSLGNMSYCSAR